MLGDNGRFYVSPELVPLYSKFIETADFITPNQFEAEALSGLSCKYPQKVLTHFHKKGIKTVVITSVETEDLDILTLYASSQSEKFRIECPKYLQRLTGTGDLFCALLVGYMELNDLKMSCLMALSVMQEIISDTIQRSDSSAYPDLCIIENKRMIENPKISPKLKVYDFIDKE